MNMFCVSPYELDVAQYKDMACKICRINFENLVHHKREKLGFF